MLLDYVQLSKGGASKQYGELTDLRNKLDTGEIDQGQYLDSVKKINDSVQSYLNNVNDPKSIFKNLTPDQKAQISNNYAPLFEDYLTPTLNTSNPISPKGLPMAPNPGVSPGAPNVPQRPIYTDTSGYRDIVRKYAEAGKTGADSSHQIGTYAETFRQMFNSSVGRDPTTDEYNQFFNTIVVNDKPWEGNLDQNQLRQETSGLLQQFYSGTAQEEAQKKAEAAATGAVAPGSAFDVWSNSYRNSINDVSSALQDYQSRLFEKLRPQLLTSLKAQGLLDTGGLNQAFAGAAEDLGAESQKYLAGAKSGIEGDIAQQKYNLMSAPTTFKLSNAFNTVPQLTQSGQTALQNVYGNYVNQNMFNQNAALQREMADRQASNQPSLLSQYGGLILGGMAGGLGQGLGKKLAFA